VAHGFVLRFPWHEEEDVAEAIDNCDDDLSRDEYATITLQGGIAFGTGEHPTTRLCLKFLRDTLTADAEESDEESPKVRKLLDYGSGSGVLGLAACSLSPELSTVGIDIDADAVAIANANAEINGLSMLSYLPAQKVIDNGDAESASVMMRGAAANAVETLPSDLDGPIFDACAANILAGPLIGLATTLAGMVKPGGKIGLSGILEAQAQNVVTAYSEFFEDVKVAASEGGWVLITGRRAN
jgi:ribosomal protein L11 methyltransferase